MLFIKVMLQFSMKRLMSVSVVIPAYNEEGYIQDCVEALIPQLAAQDEIIVVDNGSLDDTIAAVPKHPQVKLLHQPRRGRSYAQQLGFQAANSDIIARIDADTIVNPRWLHQIKDHFEQPKVVAVSGLGEAYDVVLKHVLTVGIDFWLTKVERPLAGTHVMWGSNCAFRRLIWRAHLDEFNPNSGIHEDFDMAFVLSKYGQIIYDPKLMIGFANRLVGLSSKRLLVYPIMSVRTYYQAGLKLQAIVYMPIWLAILTPVIPLIALEEVLKVIRSTSLWRRLRVVLYE